MGCSKNSLIKKLKDIGGDDLDIDVFPFYGVDIVVNNAEFNTTVWDEDQIERGINKNEEGYGLTEKYAIDTTYSSGFKLILIKKFAYGLNNLFYFEKI